MAAQTPIAAFTRAAGSGSMRIRAPLASATLREALTTPGPVVIEAIVDPEEPPLPPKTTIEFGKNFAEALVRSSEGASKIIANVAAEKVRGLI